MFRRQRPESDAIEVIIGPRATFQGDLRCDASVRIDGTYDGGKVETVANVILTETARVKCDITAKTVSIRGTFQGIIHADRVELLEGSQVYGALHVNSFFMDDGVLLQAELKIQGVTPVEMASPSRPDPQSSIPVVNSPNPPTDT